MISNISFNIRLVSYASGDEYWTVCTTDKQCNVFSDDTHHPDATNKHISFTFNHDITLKEICETCWNDTHASVFRVNSSGFEYPDGYLNMSVADIAKDQEGNDELSVAVHHKSALIRVMQEYEQIDSLAIYKDWNIHVYTKTGKHTFGCDTTVREIIRASTGINDPNMKWFCDCRSSVERGSAKEYLDETVDRLCDDADSGIRIYTIAI